MSLFSYKDKDGSLLPLQAESSNICDFPSSKTIENLNKKFPQTLNNVYWESDGGHLYKLALDSIYYQI
ncbi:hypothetical protein ATX23_09230 [Oenococcus oeni]|uniref:hypothetical protein n=1 Tax=Oenococcus oeni TaxID=1247 RepID=UPI0008F8DC34|nr:hypothetical protein [Oenococcus oeni]OIL58336.1 hypothetical protein ATX23_09230 [Oenococcus oeni]